MKNLKLNLFNKTNTFTNLVNNYKNSGFYLKSLQIKTDYSRYKKYFSHFHPDITT